MSSGSASCSGQSHHVKIEEGVGQEAAPGAHGQLHAGGSSLGLVVVGGNEKEAGPEAAPAAEAGDHAADGAGDDAPAAAAAAAAAVTAAAAPAGGNASASAEGGDAPAAQAGAAAPVAPIVGGAAGEGAVALGPAARAARKLCSLVCACSTQLGQAAPPPALLDAMAQRAEAVLEAGGSSGRGGAAAGGEHSMAAMKARLEDIVRSAVHAVKAQLQAPNLCMATAFPSTEARSQKLEEAARPALESAAPMQGGAFVALSGATPRHVKRRVQCGKLGGGAFACGSAVQTFFFWGSFRLL
eukprot:scaffold50470_cov18-Tisochrysis_lutea.AAC.2